MRTIDTLQRNIIGVLDSQDLVTVIDESMRLIKCTHRLAVTLTNEYDGDIDAKECEELDAIDVLAGLPFPRKVNAMKLNSCCYDTGIQFRCVSFLVACSRVLTLAKNFAEAYVPLTNSERADLLQECVKLIAHGANFIYYQFNIVNYIEAVKEGYEDVPVNIDLLKYCESKSLPLDKMMNYFDKLVKKYRTTLPLFTEYPELEDQFIKLVGPFYSEFEEREEFLTIDMVKQLFTQEILVEELLEILKLKAMK